jgi:hypothetical protein
MICSQFPADDGSLWTTVIPPALVNFISIEERGKESPDGLNPGAFEKYQQNMQQLLATVPAPPTVPRHLKDPILNTSPKELEGTIGGTAGDDNSILPVPNHVVLNHLTAAAIRNGTLAVGTTTRYKRKVRPIFGELREGGVPVLTVLIPLPVHFDPSLQTRGPLNDRTYIHVSAPSIVQYYFDLDFDGRCEQDVHKRILEQFSGGLLFLM